MGVQWVLLTVGSGNQGRSQGSWFFRELLDTSLELIVTVWNTAHQRVGSGLTDGAWQRSLD
jgi:hypothetical protein